MTERVQCWPDGHLTGHGGCEEILPDSEWETIEKFGWGWVEARDAGSESGLGMFYACPWHRSDCTPEERAAAISRNEAAKKGQS